MKIEFDDEAAFLKAVQKVMNDLQNQGAIKVLADKVARMASEMLIEEARNVEKSMLNADIVAAVSKATGMSLRELSLENGLAAGTLQQALHRPYPKSEKVIAEAIGMKPNVIWPERYNRKRAKRSG